MGACGSKDKTSTREGRTSTERKVAWERIRRSLPREKTTEAKERRIELFKKFDKNDNGKLTFGEAFDGCRDVLKLDEFTTRLGEITKHAFNKAKDMGDKAGIPGSSDCVEFLEFRLMLCYIYDYFELTVMFDEIDTSGNMLIEKKEFKQAAGKLNSWGAKIDDPDKVFKDLDKNGSGSVTFDEFAAWASAKKLDADGDPDNI